MYADYILVNKKFFSQLNLNFHLKSLIIIWFFGNLACLAFNASFWPFSSFDMFTQYSLKGEVQIIYSVVKSLDNEILYRKAESSLPVYRFWQNKSSIDTAASRTYVTGYLNFHKNLRQIFESRDDLVFLVFRGADFESAEKTTPLVKVKSNDL